MLKDVFLPSDTTTVASGASFSSSTQPITVINLSHKNLNCKDLARMSEQFGIEPTVHTLRLGFNDFGDAGAKVIASLLEKYPSITCLDLGFCNIGDAGIEALSSRISTSSNIEVLYLSGNCLTPSGFKYLSDALSLNNSLHTLYITANHAGTEGARWIAKGLQYNRNLTSLAINVNKIDSDGARCIADALSKNDSLTHLNLSDNNIGDSGIIPISVAMVNHKRLMELELSFNKISPTGMKSFNDNIIGYHSLTRLLLDNNKICDAGAHSLALAIPHMQLTELNVGFNEIGPSGLISIVQCVQISPSIKKLTLSGNMVDNDVAKVLATMLLKNCVVFALYMDNCSISTMGERFIGTGIASNKKSSLRVLTGFELAKVLVLLGSPPQIGELSNEAALRYLSQMWLHVEKTAPVSSTPGLSTISSVNCANAVATTSNPSVGLVSLPASPPLTASTSLPKRPSANSQRNLSGSHISTESPRTLYDGRQQQSSQSLGHNNLAKDSTEVAGSDHDSDNQETNSDNDSDDSYYTSDESSYDRTSTDSAYELNYEYPDSGEDNSNVANQHGFVESSPRKNPPSALPTSSSLQSMSRANSGVSKKHHHHHHYSSSEYEDSQKTEHRLRTYIVNPEVLDVAKKISTIPFSGPELWELHQYYYSPPPSTASCRSLANVLELVSKRVSMSDLSSHGALASSSVHNVGKQQLDSASDSDDGGERPHKKQSNIKTMARINLYSQIKHILEKYSSVGDDIKVLLLLRRLRYIEDCSGIYDTATIESILVDDIMEGKV